MKVLFVGDVRAGTNPAYRSRLMAQLEGVEARDVPLLAPDPRPVPQILQSVAWKLRVPFDVHGLNRRVLAAAEEFAPDILYCESVLLLRRSTLERLKAAGVKVVGMSQDWVTARHNSNVWQDACFPLYDLFFTTKTFGIEELRAAGVPDVRLANNTYEASVHHPLSAIEVGDEFDRFDCVFVGTYERNRGASIRKLAEAGFSILVHGNAAGKLSGGWDSVSHPNITVRPAESDIEYTRALHRGKIALAFLRKLNRDRITCRSIEIPAMRRPMVAERTDEHDAQFVDRVEYAGFDNDDELIERVRYLLERPDERSAMAEAGMHRCHSDHLDNGNLVERMVAIMREKFGLS